MSYVPPEVATSAAVAAVTATYAPALTPTVTETAAYTAGANQIVMADATSASFTVTLPTTPTDKSIVTVKKIDSSNHAVTVALLGGAVLNKSGGATSTTLVLQNQAVTLQYATTGKIWYAVAEVPVSALDTRYAPIASPSFSGTVTLPSAAPTVSTQATPKSYVDAAVATKAPSASPTFTGTVTLPSTAPTVSTQAAPKSYVDSAVATKAPLASPTFTGTVTVPTPVNPTDAVTKAYADSLASTGTADATTTTEGKIQLAGDLAGTALAPTVAAVNGVAVSGVPVIGQVLTATSPTAASWATPATVSGSSSSANVVVYSSYSAAPALPANTVVISISGS